MLRVVEEGECREKEMEGGQRGDACILLGIFRGNQVHINEEMRLFILKKKKSVQRGRPLSSLFVYASPQ